MMAPLARLFLDANVLFSAQLRSLLLTLAEQRHIEVFWSAKVQDEWRDALIRHRPELAAGVIRVQTIMENVFPEAAIVDFEQHIVEFDLPDNNDRHVAAAAFVGKCQLILTFNVQDFPSASLQRHGLVAVHPDTFLAGMMLQNPKDLLCAMLQARGQLRNPVVSAETYLDALAQLGLRTTVALARPYVDAI